MSVGMDSSLPQSERVARMICTLLESVKLTPGQAESIRTRLERGIDRRIYKAMCLRGHDRTKPGSITSKGHCRACVKLYRIAGAVNVPKMARCGKCGHANRQHGPECYHRRITAGGRPREFDCECTSFVKATR